MSHEALARSVQHREEVRHTPYLPTGMSVLPGMGMVPKWLGRRPKPSPQSRARPLLASLWPRWALLVLALQFKLPRKTRESTGTGWAARSCL